MYTPVRREASSSTNEMAFHTPINFSKELKQVLYERNLLTAQTRKKIGSMLDTSGTPERTPNSEMNRRKNFRLQAIQEIVSSEKTYLKQLEILMQFFVVPLKEQSIINNASHTTLFGQIEMIYNLNGELLREIESDMENVAKAFLKMAPFFKLYSVYAFDYRNALLIVQELTSKNPIFRKFLEQTESRPEVQRKLNSLMIVPIQRVPRYKLLLEQVLLYTSPADADFKLLKESVKLVESTVSHINACIEDQEVTQLLINLQNSLVNHTPSIVKPSRKVIKEGVLHKVSRNGTEIKRYCVLMSDIFMYCKILKDRAPNTIVENSLECCCIFPLKKCKVYELFPGNFKVTCQGDGIILCTTDLQLGRTWVAFIRDAIELHIQCRKTLRKESSKRTPIRKKDIKKFESDNVLSPKRKCDYETVFRNKNRSTDSEDEGKSETSKSCFPRVKSGSSSPYMPSQNISNIPKRNQIRKRPAPPPPVSATTENLLRTTKTCTTKTSSASINRVSKLYKFISNETTRTRGILKKTPISNSARSSNSSADHDPTYGFASRYSDSKSYFRAHNVDNTIPTTITRADFMSDGLGDGNFRDILFPLRSSGSSNKSGGASHNESAGWSIPSQPMIGKENVAFETPPQRKRVKFDESKDSSYTVAITKSAGNLNVVKRNSIEAQQQKPDPYVFSSELVANGTTQKISLRDKIYEFFAKLF